MGYEGEAGQPCSKINEEFILTGLEKTKCSTPSDITGYIVTENNLNVPEFDIEAKCDETNGYFGEPNISSCDENLEPYILEGCEFKNQECSIPDTTGYP